MNLKIEKVKYTVSSFSFVITRYEILLFIQLPNITFLSTIILNCTHCKTNVLVQRTSVHFLSLTLEGVP